VSRLLAVILRCLLLILAPAAAIAAEWRVEAVEGTALALVGDQWEELSVGRPVERSLVMRTLRSGRVKIQTVGVTIGFGGNTAAELRFSSGGVRVLPYSGSVVVQISGQGTEVVVATPELSVSAKTGAFSVALTRNRAEVAVQSGRVIATDAQGNEATLEKGDKVRTTESGLPTAAGPNGGPSNPNANGGNVAGNAAGNASGNTGSGSNGNSAGNGNSGGGNGNSSGGGSGGGGNGDGGSGGNGGGGGGGNGGGSSNGGGGGNSGG
jgi:hypothetical protein